MRDIDERALEAEIARLRDLGFLNFELSGRSAMAALPPRPYVASF